MSKPYLQFRFWLRTHPNATPLAIQVMANAFGVKLPPPEEQQRIRGGKG